MKRVGFVVYPLFSLTLRLKSNVPLRKNDNQKAKRSGFLS